MNDCGCMNVCGWVCGHLKNGTKIRITVGNIDRHIYITNVLCNDSYLGKC